MTSVVFSRSGVDAHVRLKSVICSNEHHGRTGFTEQNRDQVLGESRSSESPGPQIDQVLGLTRSSERPGPRIDQVLGESRSSERPGPRRDQVLGESRSSD
ncbi:hypothetical protein INR49_020649 [Caranx melampygus]|nr:hypothetical protein INR49_020649 [Caranx melampygus]